MGMDEVLLDAEERMGKSLQTLEGEYAMIRAGRANPNLLSKVSVSYYGAMTPVSQVANVSVPEARILQISPWDKTMIRDIEKAIMASDIGITPTNDGQNIRLVFPELTGERRQELSKDIKKKAEASKVAIRNIRRDAVDAVKKLQKNSEITEDDEKDAEDQIQKLTDKFIKNIDDTTEKKTKEIMTV